MVSEEFNFKRFELISIFYFILSCKTLLLELFSNSYSQHVKEQQDAGDVAL